MVVVFVHFDDQRIYALDVDVAGATPRPLTPLSTVGGGLRWSDPEIDLGRGEVRCILEEFTGDGPGDLRRVIAAVPLDGSAAEDRAAVRELSDDKSRFLSSVRYAPDGRRVLWLAWNHPHMPWDAAELRIADIDDDGYFREVRTLMGRPGDPFAQAEWMPDGSVLAAAERSGWWNLYRIDPASGKTEVILPAEEDFAGLQRMGLRWFVPLPDGRVAVLHGQGAQRLALLDPETAKLTELTDTSQAWSEWLPHLAASGTNIVGVAGGPVTRFSVVFVETTTGTTTVLSDASSAAAAVESAFLPTPEQRTFTAADGRSVHATLHAPRNPHATGPADAAPPWIVWAHPGPGLRPARVLNLESAFFTSRGLGVVEVDYGGTPGYGRGYRERLRGQWGVVDVEDCATVARTLLDEGRASHVAIRGLSAGGFTAAASLVGTDIYACAVLICPLLDLSLVAEGGTHDFEAHYLDWLVGHSALSAKRYSWRSPATHPELIAAPFVLLQGAEDVVCPPEQSAEFLRRVRAEGQVEYVHRVFPDEGHGFRRPESLAESLELELALYARVFGFAA